MILQGDIQTFNGLTFNSGNAAGGTGTNFYKIQGYQGLTNGAQTGRLQLAGASNVITTASNVEAAIAADLVGTNGLVKEGIGQLGVLRTTNNLSGTIDVKAGTLTFGNSTQLTNANVVVRSNAVLDGVGTINNLSIQSGATHVIGSGNRTYANELNGSLFVEGDAIYDPGTTLIWSLRANTNVQTINTNTGAYSFSSINVGGNLSIGTNTTLRLNFLDGVNWADSFWGSSQTNSLTSSNGWLVFGTGLTNTVFPTLSATNTWIDSGSNSLASVRGTNATFYLTNVAGNIYLNYLYNN